MIIKPRVIPEKLLQLESLQKLLRKTHIAYPLIEKAYKIERAGWQGEQSMDYYYDLLVLPSPFWLHQLRLQLNSHFFQMDTLLVTPKFILILEIKNVAGRLVFDHAHQQLIRTIGDQLDVFQDPVLQVEQQAASLQSWIQPRSLTNQKAEIKEIAPHPRHQKIIRPPALREIIENLSEQYHRQVSPDSTRTIAEALRDNHRPQPYSAMKKYNVTMADLRKGVFCPNCDVGIMEYWYGKWTCPHCRSTSYTAHYQALRDYAKLISPHISSGKCRDFLNLASTHIAKRLLQKMKLPSSGEDKWRVYHLHF
ncbi:nuclease-related domain-containing protein [Natribacillus halophilus]|uniref:Nuclease-related domain-containing protein n=1 Tax=Natribacillus halophilus TaxID=549003 RepID=A0A1G8KQY3_9BACI|nr:nuclease-related domain-containing protein [Natribacillus halophilus]SDI45799.1 Nuclease-related domain-containing protein [Natribacillus halophilus]